MITNENDFAFIRRSILNKPTIPEYQIASRIAKSVNVNSEEKVDNPLVKARLGKQMKFDTNLIIHYTHEKRFQSFKRDIHQNYDNVFKHKPAMELKLIVGNRNRRDAKNELIRKRPTKRLLQNKTTHSKY